jgi:hypothetical protein
MAPRLDDILEIRGPATPQPRTEIAAAQFDELQRVSNYRLVRKTLRPAGIGSIVFGLIAIATGFGGTEANPINAVLGLIGLFLLLEGIWIVSAPKPGGMIVDGIALLILGLWNIIVTISNSASGGGGGSHFFAILGVWQIIWGCQSFGRYSRFSKLPMSKPSEATLKMINEIVKAITKAKSKDTPDLLEFLTKAFISQQLWKGRLSQDSAVFVQGSGQDVVFSKKNQVQFDKQSKALIGKKIKAAFRLGERSMNGTISPEYFERYEAWKRETQ